MTVTAMHCLYIVYNDAGVVVGHLPQEISCISHCQGISSSESLTAKVSAMLPCNHAGVEFFF